MGVLLRELRRRVRRNERGQSLVIMLLIILPVLIFVLGLAYDLGNVATGMVVGQDGADLAATEAGKLVDADYFRQWGEVRLRPEALMIAQQVADDLTGGMLVVNDIYLDGSTVVVVEGHVPVTTPFFKMFLNWPSIDVPVRGISRTSHGAEMGGE